MERKAAEDAYNVALDAQRTKEEKEAAENKRAEEEAKRKADAEAKVNLTTTQIEK